MAKEDILLREEMGRLEIEPIKLKRSRSDENPFYNFISQSKRGFLKKSSVQSGLCFCASEKKIIGNAICKRKHNKILKEPVLQILKTHPKVEREDCEPELNTFSHTNINTESLSLCTLVKTCNQLKISSEINEGKGTVRSDGDKTKWWKNEVVCLKENREQRHPNQTGSCSQQALNPPCDVTIDELASYFETLVHIPKKMSSMAEMMYI